MFRLLGPFDFGRRLAHDPFASPQTATALGVELVDIESVFRESDFVAVNCPLNAQTRGLVNGRLLGLMKRTAYFVNTARGGVVVEEDLVRALSERRIAGAGLDVFQKEPLPVDSPLVRMDNVILAPHGLGYTDDLVRGNGISACENVLAVLQGEVPRHVVNRQVVERPGFQAKLADLRRRWPPAPSNPQAETEAKRAIDFGHDAFVDATDRRGRQTILGDSHDLLALDIRRLAQPLDRLGSKADVKRNLAAVGTDGKNDRVGVGFGLISRVALHDEPRPTTSRLRATSRRPVDPIDLTASRAPFSHVEAPLAARARSSPRSIRDQRPANRRRRSEPPGAPLRPSAPERLEAAH